MLSKIVCFLDWQIVFLRILIVSAIVQFSSILLFYITNDSGIRNPFSFYDETNDFVGTCALPIYDFSDPQIMEMLNPNHDPLNNCDKNFVPLTALKNGSWMVLTNDPRVNCKARCHRRKTDFHNFVDEWIDKPGPVDCEILETICKRSGVDIYGCLHTQIISPSKKYSNDVNTSVKKLDKPDVFVIMLDSLSFGEAKRSLKKSLSYFSSELNGVEFPFVNKVGENSRPNAVALWFGKMLTKVDNEIRGGQNEETDWDSSYFCDRFKDNESNIFRDFREDGYKTLLAEDWREGAVNFPNCDGFKDPPTHHYMRTFQNAYEADGEMITQMHLKGHNCREEHQPMFEYNEQFMDKYKDKPKFSWIWVIEMGHWNPSGYYRFDQKLLDYFERNKDFYQQNTNFTSEEYLKIPGERGDSLIRNQLDTPRTCGTLPIPNQFCICQMTILNVDNPSLGRYLGRKLADQINLKLQSNNFSEYCSVMEYSKTASLQKYEDKKNERPYTTYIITVSMSYPSFARFKAYVNVGKSDNDVMFGAIMRTNRYSRTGGCIKMAELQSMCFCKDISLFNRLNYYRALFLDFMDYYIPRAKA